jgi:isoaspartyl peptidase/L-asparaginase-like protein (Ntn-hydrolase superfamily)
MRLLEQGVTPPQGIIAAIQVMENSPHFNAGKGSIPKPGKHDRCIDYVQ